MYNIHIAYFIIFIFSLLYLKHKYRLIIAGNSGDNGYISRFLGNSIGTHPDLTSTSWTMDPLSSGTDDVISVSGETISAIYSLVSSSVVTINQTASYSVVSTFNSDVYVQNTNQSISINENDWDQTILDVTCSSGSTSIQYTLINEIMLNSMFNRWWFSFSNNKNQNNCGTSSSNTTLPSWVNVDSSTRKLIISSPDVSSNTDYYFYIQPNITGYIEPIQSLVKLTVKRWDRWSSSCSDSNSNFLLSFLNSH